MTRTISSPPPLVGVMCPPPCWLVESLVRLFLGANPRDARTFARSACELIAENPRNAFITPGQKKIPYVIPYVIQYVIPYVIPYVMMCAAGLPRAAAGRRTEPGVRSGRRGRGGGKGPARRGGRTQAACAQGAAEAGSGAARGRPPPLD